ncbi:MAG TPA: DUF1877 family protein [Oculatellaceae cyanobacterium]
MWDKDNTLETDKAWDAIHRYLSDGTTDFRGGSYPLNICILGGTQLYREEDYIINYVPPALTQISRSWFEEKYWQLPEDYDCDKGEEDLDYSWEYFCPMVEFFEKAAREGKPVIFTVDQ